MKKYKITYRLPKGNDGQLHMVIEAATINQAKRIFEEMYPGLIFSQAVPVR